MNASPRTRLWLAALPALFMTLGAMSCAVDPPALACQEYCTGCCTAEGVCLATAAQSASACGLQGAACGACDGTSCVAGICGGDGTSCGQADQVCCAQGTACARGLTCSGGTCVASSCGQEGQACCADDACNFGLSCNAGTCGAAQCGAQGQACCGGDPASACGSGLVCSGGSCQTSGTGTAAVGQACTDGSQCAGGRCLSSSNYPGGYCARDCTSSSDCPTGSVCGPDPTNSLNQVCLDACAQAGVQSDCRSGYVCDRSGSHQAGDPAVCVPRCTASTNFCGTGNVCNTTTGLCAGKAGYGCLPDGTCNGGGTCTSGYCEAPPAYGGPCTDKTDCASGGVCLVGWNGGYCSGTCRSGEVSCLHDGGGCSIHTIEDGDGNPNNNPNACLATCTGVGTQGSCRSGYVCDVGWTDKANQTSCVPFPTCTSDSQCAGIGARCASGLCCGQRGLACCGSGAQCDAGSCNSEGLCQ